MKKFIYLFSLTLACTFLLSSCSADTPGQVAKDFVGYLKSGDSKKMMGTIAMDKDMDQSDKKQAELAAAAMAEKAKAGLEEKGGLKNVEIVSETIDEDGETAKVVLKLTYGNGNDDENTYKMVKQDGKWKIRQ